MVDDPMRRMPASGASTAGEVGRDGVGDDGGASGAALPGSPDPVLDPTASRGTDGPEPTAPRPAEPAGGAGDDREAPNEPPHGPLGSPDPERTGRYRTSDTATGEPGT